MELLLQTNVESLSLLLLKWLLLKCGFIAGIVADIEWLRNKFVINMVILLDGCSFHYFRIWSKSGISICSRHLVTSKESLNPGFFLRKDLFYIERAQHVLSYHLYDLQLKLNWKEVITNTMWIAGCFVGAKLMKEIVCPHSFIHLVTLHICYMAGFLSIFPFISD